MQLHISTRDGVPIYVQIVNQVKFLVASGRLNPGDQLPPVRKLAEQLVINPNTVARAYRELELAGIVTARQGSGAFISGNGSPLGWKEKSRQLTQRIDMLVAEARQMNVELETVLKLVQQRYRAFARSDDSETSP